MYVLYRGTGNDQWEPIGFYHSYPEAVCAYEEECRKEDGLTMKIEDEENEQATAQNAGIN